MTPFRTHTGIAVPLDRANVDTDQIIPKQFLKRIERAGFGEFLFFDWRFRTNGERDSSFVLNDPRYSAASILVAAKNFGCGSSREHAPWALHDYGFRAVISTGIADIFTSNALKNGLLPVVVDQATWDDLVAHPEQPVTIDLKSLEVRRGNHPPVAFAVEPFARQCLLDGVDTLGWLLNQSPAVDAFESAHAPPATVSETA